MNPTQLRALFAQRQHAANELRGLYDAAADRELDANEVATEVRLNATLVDLAARIDGGLQAIEADAAADEARARFEAIEVRNTPARHDDPVVDHIRQFALGEIRSIEIGPGSNGWEQRDLLSGTATDGQELVPQSMYSRIIEHMVATSPVMRLVSGGPNMIRTSGGNPLEIPVTTAYSASALVAEAAAISESDPQFDTVTFGAYKIGHLTDVAYELLADSAFDVPGFLSRQGGASLGRRAETYFVAGTGSSQPQGVVNATLGKTFAGTAAITMDELVDLKFSVADVYRPGAVWLMKDSTIALVAKLKDSTGQYLWQPSRVIGEPDTLLGHPLYAAADMPAATTGLKSVVFGDVANCLAIRMAGPVRIERSEHAKFESDLVVFRFIARIDSRIVDTNGIRHGIQA